ncbi:MAG: DNA/RNA nuclease SfsA [Candidatus Alcyoniella australis]|nr:DNA/RNA nuclease SfsA [Candidatus Alcyoniella australis]
MIVDGPLISGKLVRRYKRFLMDLELDDGSLLTVHCPNSGSMEGCLEPGARVLASPGKGKGRKLSHSAEWIELAIGWVGINTMRTNQIAREALLERWIPELAQYDQVRPEYKISSSSRIDFLLQGNGLPDCYVEVKNTTLPMPQGAIAFPDSSTERGRKHLRELILARQRGIRAVMLYVVNRPDGEFFRAAHEKDPQYADLLCQALQSGVEALAYRTLIQPPAVRLDRPIPIKIDEQCNSNLSSGEQPQSEDR